jgi:D-alanyl-D-alanine carboxypeptidase
MRTSINNRRTTIAAVLVAVGLVGTAGTASAATTTPADALQTAAQQGVANGYPGVIGLVEENGAATTVSAGVGNRSTNAAADPTAQFRIGSVTKTFIAADLLLLESQGKLSVDDTVAKWLPGVVNANGNDGTKITIRELLDMTSGLPDYDTKLTDWNSSTQYTPLQLVNLALTSSPTSAPGAAVNYTNTAYIVAGMVIQQVTGNDPSVEVANDIIKPLGLTNTSFPTTDHNLSGNYLHGYELPEFWIGAPPYTDVTATNPSLTWAAGAMVSTEQDLATFYRDLFTGKLLPAAQLTEMETGAREGTTDNYFDLGIETISTPCGPMYSKNGAVPGYANLAVSSGDGSKQVMIAGNEYNLHPGQGFDAIVAGAENAYCAS